jgi:hypothetical protein
LTQASKEKGEKIMSNETDTAKKVVAVGGAFLDTMRDDDWRSEIDTHNLSLASTTRCIVGQLYGEYDDGLRALGINNVKARGYGFESGYTDDTSVGSYALNDAWKEYLAQPASGVRIGTILRGAFASAIALKVISSVSMAGELYWISEEGRVGSGQFVPSGESHPAVNKASEILGSWKIWTPNKVKAGKFYTFTAQFDLGPSVWYAQTDGKLWKMSASGATWISAIHAEKKSDFAELNTNNGSNFNDHIAE